MGSAAMGLEGTAAEVMVVEEEEERVAVVGGGRVAPAAKRGGAATIGSNIRTHQVPQVSLLCL